MSFPKHKEGSRHTPILFDQRDVGSSKRDRSKGERDRLDREEYVVSYQHFTWGPLAQTALAVRQYDHTD